jgi:hypothetical protein
LPIAWHAPAASGVAGTAGRSYRGRPAPRIRGAPQGST